MSAYDPKRTLAPTQDKWPNCESNLTPGAYSAALVRECLGPGTAYGGANFSVCFGPQTIVLE
jgi:hypothetical protein